MTRAGAGETIVQKPKNNIFTWMSGAAMILSLFAFLLTMWRLRSFD